MSNKSYQNNLFKRIIDLGVVSSADVDDLVRIWRVGSGDEKAITLANFVATVDADLGSGGSSLTELIDALELEVANKLDDAPSDGNTYGRKDGVWESISGQVPVREVFTYSASNTFSLSNSNPTAIYVALNGQVLEEGSSYDWTISGTTLTVTTPLESGDEISILYYTDLPSVTTYGRNIDGGAPDSVYLAIQNVDGGTP